MFGLLAVILAVCYRIEVLVSRFIISFFLSTVVAGTAVFTLFTIGLIGNGMTERQFYESKSDIYYKRILWGSTAYIMVRLWLGRNPWTSSALPAENDRSARDKHRVTVSVTF